MDAVTSKAIDILRGIAILMVVILHAHTGMQFTSEAFSTFADIVSRGFGALGVPIFMAISGFLSGIKYNPDDPVSSFRNVISRCIGLSEVYIVWNSIVFLAVLAMLRLGANPGEFLLTRFHDGLVGIFGINSAFPIAYQFWFIRELILISLAVACIAYIARNKGILSSCLAIIAIFGHMIFDYRTEICIVAFGAAYLCGRFRVLSKVSAFTDRSLVTAMLAMGAASSIFLTTAAIESNWTGPALNLFLASGTLCAVFGTLKLSRYDVRHKLSKIIAGSSFFIFSAHEPFLTAIKKVLGKHLQATEVYMLSPLLVISVLYLFYTLCPVSIKNRFSLIFHGNRGSKKTVRKITA